MTSKRANHILTALLRVSGVTITLVGLCLMFIPNHVLASIDDEPIGISGEAEKASIARYLISDYRFNEDNDVNSTSYIKNTHPISVLGFDGNNNRVKVDSRVNIDEYLTVSAWLNLYEKGRKQIILNQEIDSYNKHFELLINDSNLLEFSIKDSNGTLHTVTQDIGSFDTNQWYFVSGVLNHNSSHSGYVLDLFVNGTKVNSSSTSFTDIATEQLTPSELYIGSTSTNTDNIKGVIDQVFISSKAFSATQISKWFNNTDREIPDIIPNSYFDLLLNFDEQSGNKAKDSSINKNDATLIGYKLSGWFRSDINGDNIGAYGMQFDGIDDFAKIETDSIINQASTDGTLALGFSINTYPSAGESATIFATTNKQSSIDSFKIFINDEGKLYYEITDDGVVQLSLYNNQILKLNDWYHLTLTNSNSGHSIYLNGTKLTTTLQYQTGTNTSDIWFDDIDIEEILLGSFRNSERYQEYFSGAVQFVHYYPLSSDDDFVSRLYNFGKPAKHHELFKLHINTSFEIDFFRDEGKYFRGEDTDSIARLFNIMIRGPPPENFSNPIFYENSGISFNDSSDYVDIKTDASLKDSEEFSVQVQFKYTKDALPTSKAHLYREELSSGTERVNIYLNNEGKLVCSIKDNNNLELVSDSVYADNLWHQAICTFNSSSVRLYLDGNIEKVGTGSINDLSGSSANKIYIGDDSSGSDNKFIGEIDDVSVVKRSLSSSQVKNMWLDSNSISNQVSLDKIVGHWKFDTSSLLDSSPNDYHIISSSVDLVSPELSDVLAWHSLNISSDTAARIKHNNKLNFDGIDDYIKIELDEEPSFLEFEDGNIALEAWIKTDKDNGYILSRENSLSESFNLQVLNKKIKFSLYSGVTAYSITGDEEISDNEWHHIFTQYDSEATTMSIYIDGYLDTSSVISISEIENLNADIAIGSIGTLNNDYFKGSISNVRIYDQVLSSEEILAQYVNPTILYPNSLSLNFNINEGGGTMIFDSTQNRLSGLLHNFSPTSWKNPTTYLELNGVDQYIEMNDENPTLESGEDLSISLWLKPEYDGANKTYTLIEQSNDKPLTNIAFKGYRIDLVSDSTPDFYHINAAVGITSGQAYMTTEAVYIPDGVWSHLVMAFDQSTGLYIYLNGENPPIVDSVNGSSLQFANNPILIGKSIIPTTEYFKGGLSNISLYNYFLGENDVFTLMNNFDNPIPSLYSSTKYNLPLNDNNNIYVKDKISTLFGGKTFNDPNWITENTSFIDRVAKKQHSSALHLNYTNNEYVDFGSVVTANENIAVEMVVAGDIKNSESQVTLLDYGYDGTPRNGEFAVYLTNKGSLKLDISDGRTNTPESETFETAPNLIKEGQFATITFIYNYEDNKAELYINNSLKLDEYTDFAMHQYGTHDPTNTRLQIKGTDGNVVYRSLIVAIDENGDAANNLDIINQTRVLEATFNEGTGNVVRDTSLANNGTIYNKGCFITIPQAEENPFVDITGKYLIRQSDGRTILDGKTSSLILPHTNDISFDEKDFAIEFWIKPYTTNGVFPILEKGKSIFGDATINDSIFLYLDNGNLKGIVGGVEISKDGSAPLLEEDKMYHFILQRDNSSTDNMSLKYFDDTSTRKKYWNDFQMDSTLSNNEPINIGYSVNTSNISGLEKYFAGEIDEIRILRRPYNNSDLVPNNVDDLSLTVRTNKIFNDSPGLISRYSFNDDRSYFAYDNINNHDGEINADLSRFFNNGGRFDGEDTYVEIIPNTTNDNHGDNININSNEFTLEAWVSLDSTSRDQIIVSKKGSGSRVNYELSFDDYDGFVFTVADNSDDYSVNSGLTNIMDNKSYHVAGVYDLSENTISIYINGQYRASTNISVLPNSSNTSHLYFGDNDTHSDDDKLEGNIYQVRLWDKALTNESITYHNQYPFNFAGQVSVENLLSEWRFDQESGNTLYNTLFSDLDGVVVNSNDDFWGEEKGSGYFDGLNDHVEIPDDEDLDFESTENYTISAWIKMVEGQSDNFVSIISKGDPFNSEAGYALGIDSNLSQLKFKASNGDVSGSVELMSKTQLNDNHFHHVSITYNHNNDTLKLYVDSILEDISDNISLNLSNSKSQVLGALEDNDGSLDNYFKGYLDDVRIFEKHLTQNEIYSQYIEGSDNLNQVSYTVLIKNNSNENIYGDIDVENLLPPFVELSDDIEIFTAPTLKNEVTNNGDNIAGNNYKFTFDFNDKPLKPDENIVINFSGRLAEIYERYSLENISDLKIISTTDPVNFTSTINVRNIASGGGTPINGGNNIAQGEQSKINIHYIHNTGDSVYEDIVGDKNLSDIDFSSEGSGLETDPDSPHGPVSLEPPTINPNLPTEEEYLRAYKRHDEDPNLLLEYMIPSNDSNKNFYNLKNASNDLRLQWKLQDDPSSIDGFIWWQTYFDNNDSEIDDCQYNNEDCIGDKVDNNIYDFTAQSGNPNPPNTPGPRPYKLQEGPEAYAYSYTFYEDDVTGGAFAESYYFTYLYPRQGKNKFIIKARDSLGNWGDQREVEFWIDGEKPTSESAINGTDEKIQNPDDPYNDWWRESVNNDLIVYDDHSAVSYSDPAEHVSGIDYIDYKVQNNAYSLANYSRVYDNSEGGGGLKARWNFDEAGSADLKDSTKQIDDGDIHYVNEWDFWNQNGSAAFSGNDYVDFNGDILDLPEDFTFEAWINIAQNNAGVIFSKWDNSSAKSYKLAIEGGEIYLYTSDVASGSTDTISHTSDANLLVGIDYHIVVSKSGNMPAYYVNGEQKTTVGSSTQYQFNSDTQFMIGSQNNANAHYLKGRLYELRIYNRSLTSETISRHYIDGPEGTVTSLVDNNSTVGKIETETGIYKNGSYTVQFETKDKALPPNETGISEYDIKIDKTTPSSSISVGSQSNLRVGENNDWWISDGVNGQGIIKLDFDINEGIEASSIYPGSSLKQLNTVHVINNEEAPKFKINWGNQTLPKEYFGFANNIYEYTSNEYTSENNITQCVDGSYTLRMREKEKDGNELDGVNVPVWIGGCNDGLTRDELATLLEEAINKFDDLIYFYSVTYATDTQKFTIKNMGLRQTYDVSNFSYSSGTYSMSISLTEDDGKTTEGKHEIYYFAEDMAGNIEKISQKSEFYIDTKMPKCPEVNSASSRPNAYLYRPTESETLSYYRNKSILDYVDSGYDATSVATDGLMTHTLRQNVTNPYIMWGKALDDGEESPSTTEGVNFSGNIRYSYLWEKADPLVVDGNGVKISGDFDVDGNITATGPNQPSNFSTYKSIGSFNPTVDEEVLSAHRGVLMPEQSATSPTYYDDIHDNLPITTADDGDSYFLWLRVKDEGGNENYCGEPGSEHTGSGPSYNYLYGAALRFTTQELFDSHVDQEKYVLLSEDKEDPTIFTAGPFIAGEEIQFDKLYYNYGANANSGVVLSEGAGGVENSQVVYLLNYDDYLSEEEEFHLKKYDSPVTYPATQIKNSFNLFIGNDMLNTWNTDYFTLDNLVNGIYQENDFYLNGASLIKTGSDSGQDWNQPYDINDVNNVNNTAGRLQDFGIRSDKPYINGDSYNVYQWDPNTENEKLSEVSNAEIVRGFTNVAGTYQTRFAIETSEGNMQYIQVKFDILPSDPNFDCSDNFECMDIKLRPSDE